MNLQSFSDSNSENTSSQNLSESVEILQVKLERLQGLDQTLITGLVVAIIISIGVSGWFAYRLLVQEQVMQSKVEAFEQTEAELRERLEELEKQIATQQRQIESFNEQFPQELETINSAVSSNQRQIEILRQQMNSTNETSEESEETSQN